MKTEWTFGSLVSVLAITVNVTSKEDSKQQNKQKGMFYYVCFVWINGKNVIFMNTLVFFSDVWLRRRLRKTKTLLNVVVFGREPKEQPKESMYCVLGTLTWSMCVCIVVGTWKVFL